MSDSTTTVLLVDPDPRARALLADFLKPLGLSVLHAADGPSAMTIASSVPLKLLITELYLGVGDDECLIHAVRRQHAYRRTRIVAHTHRSMAADREWAMRAGADAYLIKPTRAERVRHVVSRLTTALGDRTALPATTSSPMIRRDSLDMALGEIERGVLTRTSSIVFGRIWWDQLAEPQRVAYRKRARRAHVNLRSDSMLSNHFVEVRGPARSELGLSTERPESPYRR